MKQRSLRTHLLVWQLTGLLILFVVSCPVVSWLASELASKMYDEILLNSADSVIARVESDKEAMKVDLPPSARQLLRHEDKDSFYYQVLGPNDQLIDCDEYIPLPATRAKPGNHVFYDSVIDGTKVRALELRVVHNESSPSFIMVEVAETYNTRQAFAHMILIAFLVSQALFICGSALAIWLGVGRGLMPLKNLAQSLSQRSPSDLEPIAMRDAPTETLSLVRTVNELLGQMKDHINRQARFAANVAHQLRTPLSGMKTYVGLALRYSKDDKARAFLEQIDLGIQRLIALIEKMLVLARSDPSLLAHTIDSKVDLNSIVLDATAELMLNSEKKQIDLEVSPLPTPVEIFGDPLSLLELIKNIIENAIVHSPSGAHVRVSIDEEHGITLVVEDDGPGVPQEERERVFEPFYRTSSTTAMGTGLGLSIARDIAKAHRAAIRIEDGQNGKGTRVVVNFLNN